MKILLWITVLLFSFNTYAQDEEENEGSVEWFEGSETQDFEEGEFEDDDSGFGSRPPSDDCAPFTACWCAEHPNNPACEESEAPIDGLIYLLIAIALPMGYKYTKQ